MRKQSAAKSSASAFLPGHKHFPYGWRWFGKLLIWFLVSRNRRSVLKKERKRIPALDSAIKTVRREQLKARERGLVHAERVFNVGLYVLVMDRDFSVLKVDMVSTFESWRLRFTARQVALLLYEVCDDLSHMLGKEFRESLAFLGISEPEMRELEQICKSLGQFKNVNRQFLYVELRNLVAGHRAQDSLLFLETVEHLDPTRVFQLGADFFAIVHPLTAFLTKTTLRLGQTDFMLKQLLASPKFLASLESK
ncbi:MAG: hypothetical protein AAB676_05130 [Verrucomicrobiota bacterium]